MDTKDKTMLSNIKKTINSYKKAQSDEKELGSQLKVLKAVYNLWHLNSLLELDIIYKAQILAFLALGYKALGLDRDALVFAHNYLSLHTELVANKLPSKDLTLLQELESQIKALVRSCSRRRFDLSVRTIGVDFFIHVKSFIDYLQAEINNLKELGTDTDLQDAKFNNIIKLLKSNASCTLSLAPSGKFLVSLNNKGDDVELATLYAAFMAAVNSYGKELTDAVTFVVSAQDQGLGQAQQHATKEQALAYAGALLKSNELICPTFLQDDNCWNNNSRNLNLEPLKEEALAQVKSETPAVEAVAPAAEAPVAVTSEVMPENTTAPVTEPTVETAKQSTQASAQDLAAVAANSQEPSASNDANDVKETNNISAPMAANNDAAITIEAKSQAPRVEELGLSYSYTAIVTANSRKPSSPSSTNPQDSASSQSQSPIANSSAQDNAQASELAVVPDKESTSEPSINLSSPKGDETCSQDSSDSNSNHAADTQSEHESICTPEPELAPKSEVNQAPEQEKESVPAKTATATASAVEAELDSDTETKAKPEVATTTTLEQEPGVVSTASEAEAEAKATTKANHSANEQDSTQASFDDKESTATPAPTAPAPETKEQIATSNHELANEPKPVAKKVIKPSPIIASNAYQSKEQQKAKGGLFGFIRRIFGGK
ncbi:hypothetical protein MXE38_11385 [Anaerobiospirillum sp. NML120448]|uniref:hypothetical protein n=1 Tax=Anaerobiospirillum sp. NML120448 TaxID=2932816 RepID=UPI001FF63650|nr:hypothetical protein [Anaerobiospirillum sp. NML120448]MCK0515436.1 hypothetical protein [Anaerobiospirillum sp. NML120448]